MSTDNEKKLLQPVDQAVRAEARTMIRTARYGALALLGDDAAPSVTRVGLATDTNGLPVFPVSSLSGRVDAMTRDGRASLLIGEPGSGVPLAHGRLSLSGVMRRLDGDDHERARRRYLARHPTASAYIDFDDFSLWCLDLHEASYIAGFGRAYALVADDVTTDFDDWAAWNDMEGGAVEHMNDDHADANQLYATVLLGAKDGDWRITGLDPQGSDLALGDEHRRFEYETPLNATAALRPALVDLVRDARRKVASEG